MRRAENQHAVAVDAQRCLTSGRRIGLPFQPEMIRDRRIESQGRRVLVRGTSPCSKTPDAFQHSRPVAGLLADVLLVGILAVSWRILVVGVVVRPVVHVREFVAVQCRRAVVVGVVGADASDVVFERARGRRRDVPENAVVGAVLAVTGRRAADPPAAAGQECAPLLGAARGRAMVEPLRGSSSTRAACNGPARAKTAMVATQHTGLRICIFIPCLKLPSLFPTISNPAVGSRRPCTARTN